MNSRRVLWALGTALVFVFMASMGARAQAPRLRHLSGLINDYTPESGVSGPWEIRGAWSLEIKEDTGHADFSAVLNMEHSDLWVELNPLDSNGMPTIDTPADRVPHTHHITMTGATVTYNPTDCPLPASITPIARIEVKGSATVAANGGPFPPTGAVSSQLQVCIDGGTAVATVVPNANITLVFGAPASGHFGGQAIHGVVRKTDPPNSDIDQQ
jgi:hypothetical protein